MSAICTRICWTELWRKCTRTSGTISITLCASGVEKGLENPCWPISWQRNSTLISTSKRAMCTHSRNCWKGSTRWIMMKTRYSGWMRQRTSAITVTGCGPITRHSSRCWRCSGPDTGRCSCASRTIIASTCTYANKGSGSPFMPNGCPGNTTARKSGGISISRG